MPGWQLKRDASGALSLLQEWKVRNFQAGLELFKRIGEVAEAEGHHPDLHLEGYNRVTADLSTHSVGKHAAPVRQWSGFCICTTEGRGYTAIMRFCSFLTAGFVCVGGLTENDFIMAAKINKLSFSDLTPKPKVRFWA